MSNVRYSSDYSTRVSNCKKCKQQIPKKNLRLAKVTPSPFSDGDEMKTYFHVDCMFDTFLRARATTQVIETPGDLEGFGALEEDDKKKILEAIDDLADKKKNGVKGTPKKVLKQTKLAVTSTSSPSKSTVQPTTTKTESITKKSVDVDSPTAIVDGNNDDSLDTFIALCKRIAKQSKYTEKTQEIKNLIERKSYSGDLYLLIKMLMMPTDQRVYNMKEKQLIKIFANIFNASANKMTDHFNNTGEISLTIESFCPKAAAPPSKSLSLQFVDAWLDGLTTITKEEDQELELRKIVKKTTPEQLRWIICFIKKDLRINAGVKHIMEALDANAYAAFQSSRNLQQVVQKVMDRNKSMAAGGTVKPSKQLSISIQLGTAVLPQLAEPCRSVAYAMKKCPNGMYAEIKYDGERVQLHKSGHEFTFFSRSLKPVQGHKVADVKKHVTAAFASGDDLILDSEVLVVDTTTGQPLPFGTLGKHKKNQQSNAQVCLFVFDCIMYNGKSLMDKPLFERKKVLEKEMVEVKHRVMFSDYQLIKYGVGMETQPLQQMIDGAIEQGLEGLVLKDINGVYEPGKRHWLKVKKDYLDEGSMADTADLLVLGAYYGTGNKGGQMSVFLMGVHDPVKNCYLTVTKCGNGHDDATLAEIHKDCMQDMVKIGKQYDKLPAWLRCSRSLVPDFVMKDPKLAAVWEVTGAEFSKSDNHTAAGISIRFPRVTRIRDDKNWQNATNLQELKRLFDASKVKPDFGSASSSATATPVSTPKKRPASSDPLDESPIPKKRKSNDSSNDATPVKKEPSLLDKLMPKKRSSNDSLMDTTPVKKEPSVTDKSTPKKRSSNDSAKDTTPVKKELSVTDKPTPKKHNSNDSTSSSADQSSSKLTALKTDTSTSDDREPCRYGATCYQTNRQHRRKYSHPGDNVKDPQQLFSTLKFYVHTSIDNANKLKRHISYAGGEVMDDVQANQATHLVYQGHIPQDDDVELCDNVCKVPSTWVRDCIKQTKILPVPK